jgi:hypothetical protein
VLDLKILPVRGLEHLQAGLNFIPQLVDLNSTR